MSIVKPVLKWVGGKTQILEDVLALFPRQITNYHEPFLGGASVLLGLLSSIRKGVIHVSGTVKASDVNGNIIALYKNIQSQPDALIAEVKALLTEFSPITGTTVNRTAATLEEATTSKESYYFWIRSRFNALADKTTPLASAMLLFMNKTCFRGVYREGPRGFNVPYGNYANPAVLDEAHIREVSELLQGVVFTSAPFEAALSSVVAGDFVYLDPPYAPEASKSFVSYTVDGFGLEQHQALFSVCHALHATGATWVMSNADVPLVKEAFPCPPYTTRVIECRRAIHSKKPDTKTNEVLIQNRP